MQDWAMAVKLLARNGIGRERSQFSISMGWLKKGPIRPIAVWPTDDDPTSHAWPASSAVR